MAFRSASSNFGTGTTLSVPVPAGVQANDIVVIVATIDNSAVATAISNGVGGITGFTSFGGNSQSAPDGQSYATGWKRLTGADTGSYTLSGSIGSGQAWVVEAVAFSGRDTTNPPVRSTVNQSTAANSTPVTATASGVTALSGDDLLWIVCPDMSASGINGTVTAPTGYTKQKDVAMGFSWASVANKDGVSAGATGSVAGSFTLTSGSAGYGAYLVRIPSAAGGSTVTFAATPAGTTAVTAADVRTNRVFNASLAGSASVSSALAKTVSFLASPAGQAAITNAVANQRSFVATPAGTATVVLDEVRANRVFAAVAAGQATVIAQLDSPVGPVVVVVDADQTPVFIVTHY